MDYILSKEQQHKILQLYVEYEGETFLNKLKLFLLSEEEIGHKFKIEPCYLAYHIYTKLLYERK